MTLPIEIERTEKGSDDIGISNLTFVEEAGLSQKSARSEEDRLNASSLTSASEDIKALKKNDSPVLTAISAFAKCSRLVNLVYLRNLMLDQLYIANFRLHSLLILRHLRQKLTPTMCSRFIQGAMSQTISTSTMEEVETCGQQTTRLLNSVSHSLIISGVHEMISQHE